MAELYRLRWGVELFYRHFKQTFERRKLRSHPADHAELEATWSLLGLWAMGLHAPGGAGEGRRPAATVSVAKLLRAYRPIAARSMQEPPGPRGVALDLVRAAVIDPYRRRARRAATTRGRNARPRSAPPRSAGPRRTRSSWHEN